jgi:predicted DNA repair protein MutK
MSVGLLALLDEVAAIAKVAAASLDDIVGQSAHAGVKAAGVVIDDTAVTPRYVVGFAADREIPIVRRIAFGSMRNKLLILLPAALLLSLFAPWAINPLLMIGGAYLCYEGTEKVFEVLFPHRAHEHEAQLPGITLTPVSAEEEKIASAIKTDFVLSAEIMAIALGTLPASNVWTQAAVLGVVGIGITLFVYGAVALIVKADDAGVALAANSSQNLWGALARTTGPALVYGMPPLLTFLSIVGTAAMIWVGGGLIVHGLDLYGMPTIPHIVHAAEAAAAHALPFMAGTAAWLTAAACYGVLGLALGAVLIPAVEYVFAPVWRWLKASLRRP